MKKTKQLHLNCSMIKAMIRVKKDLKDIPPSLRGSKTDSALQNILLNPGIAKKRYHYKKDVKQKLSEIYNNKCAYCESKLSLEVDHYRPKGGVSGVKNHKGYYWLKYEWSNLLYVCHDCNQLKQTRFPLADGGIRVFFPQRNRNEWLVNSESFKAEKPLLLNPETDHPEEHLVFFYNGCIKEKNGSIRGKKTIEICNLNRRTLLFCKRKKLIDDTFRKIKSQALRFSAILKEYIELDKKSFYRLAFKTIFIEIKMGSLLHQEFSRVYFFMHEH